VSTDVQEIAEGIYRISTYVEPANLEFNQFLIMAEEPMLWHCGHRRMFPAIAGAISRVLPPERLRWLSFGHLEADEMGAMNSWLAAAHASRASAITATTGPVVRSMAARTPHTLALMHGQPSPATPPAL
jgi:flavorubredoxin